MADVDPSDLVKVYPAGTVLFEEGELGTSMYVIHDGEVAIRKDVNGEIRTVVTLGAGEFFGEMSILNDKPRNASAVVVKDARLVAIGAKTFEKMVTKNAEIAIRLIKKMATRLEGANELIEILLNRDPRARVILGLSREAETNGVAGSDGTLRLNVGAAQLAEQLGLEEKELQSVLRRLSRLGIADEENGKLVVRDQMRLHEFLEFLEQRSLAQATGSGSTETEF